MDQLGTRLKQLSSELREYIETRIDLLVLNVSDQITSWISLSIQKIIGFTIIGTGIFFGMIALAIYIGDILQNEALGYLVVAFPLMLIGLIFVMSKPFGIATSIQKQLMAGVLESLEDEARNKKIELLESKELKEGKENE
tara:strand:- start:6310 stop:6729 length:420 start_codon:yes stop_codon:yes gene_type:complete